MSSVPTPYDRQFDFTDFSTNYPSTQQPGVDIDAELNAVKVSMDTTQSRLAEIQRDDGALVNEIVTRDSLAPEIAAGIEPPYPWAAFTDYNVRQSVIVTGTAWYWCHTAHTSGATFDATNWQFIFEVSDSAYFNSLVADAISSYAAQGVIADFPRWEFTGDGVTTNFSVTGSLLSKSASYLVTLDGLLDDPNNYTVNATTDTLHFTAAPGNGVDIVVVCIGYPKAVGVGVVDGSNITTGTIPLDALVNIAALSLIGNSTGGSAVPTAVAISALASLMGLASVATTGAYASLSGLPTLAMIATSGSGADLGAGTVATAAIADAAITLAKMANIATARFIGRTTAGTGVPESLTSAQATAMLSVLVGDSGSGGTAGIVPAPAMGTAAAGKFLKADATWAVPTASAAFTNNTTYTSGTHTFTPSTTSCMVMITGGGGGGGGGGNGNYQCGGGSGDTGIFLVQNLTVGVGVTVTLGAGGGGGGTNSVGGNGVNSSFGAYVVVGGGKGGSVTGAGNAGAAGTLVSYDSTNAFPMWPWQQTVISTAGAVNSGTTGGVGGRSYWNVNNTAATTAGTKGSGGGGCTGASGTGGAGSAGYCVILY